VTSPSGDLPARCLVTGATGLLGSTIVTSLLAGGSAVTALVRDSERARRLLPAHPGLTVVTGDMNDVETYRRHLRGIDAIFHTAAYFREYSQPNADLALLRRTNVQAVEDLLYASARADVPVVVHTSSVGALGSGRPGLPADEDTPPGPLQRSNAYYASKLASERAVTTCVATTGQRVPMILPGWMWGPGDAAPTSGGAMFLAVASGKMAAVPAKGHHIVDVRDVANALLKASISGTSGRRYIVAGHWYLMTRICAEVAAATGVPAPRKTPARVITAVGSLMELRGKIMRRPSLVAAGVGIKAGMRSLIENHDIRYSSARAERELGVSFRPIGETLCDEAVWYRNHGMLGAGA
jgi:dihydroflavonol-4-reductase